MKTFNIPVFILIMLFNGLNCCGTDKTPLPGAYQIELYKNMLNGKVSCCGGKPDFNDRTYSPGRQSVVTGDQH